MSTVIRTVPAIFAALFAATATFTANAATWTGGQTGVGNTESSPYNIRNTANWDGAIGSGKQLYLTVSEKTYINSDTDTQIGNDFSPNSGDFVFMGPLKFLSFKGGAENEAVSILKKGDWTVDTWHFFAANGNKSKFTMTNETGNVKLINGSYLVVGNGANSEAEIVNISGDWTIPSFVNIGKGTGSVGSFIYNSGTLTANGVIDVGGASGAKGTLVVNGGTVNAKSNLAAGAGGNGTIIVNGGNVSVGGYLYVPYSGSGTLTINGGTVSVASDKNVQFGKGSNAINLNGGTLVTKQITRNGGNGANMQYVNLNGGTLKANNTGTLINAPDGYMWVTVSPGGGTIDCNGNAVTIDMNTDNKFTGIQGTGGLTFTGGNTITLKCRFWTNQGSYSGVPSVTPGTTLAIANDTAKNTIFSTRGVVLAGLPVAGQTNFIYTAGAFADADLDRISCPLAPDATFAFGDEGKTNIVVASAGTPLDINYWTGAIDNDLGKDGNWSKGTVPSDNANIYCVTNSTLTNGAGFAPSAITFLDGSAAVTINGDDFHNIVAVTNLSSVSHTINAKVYFEGDIQVKQAAMAGTGDLSKAHVTFAGGAYAAAGRSLESNSSSPTYSRCIFGKYYLASTSENRWTATTGGDKRVCVADGSYLYVPYAGIVNVLYVGNGAKVDIGDMATTDRPSYQVKGEMVVTNLTMQGIAGDKYISYDQGTSTPGVFKFNSVTNAMGDYFFYLADGHIASKHTFYIGAGGLNFSAGNTTAEYVIGRNTDGNYETIRPWYSDFTIAGRSDGKGWIILCRNVEFCTDDASGVGRTITIDAITRGSSDQAPKITVSGSGTLKVTQPPDNGYQPIVTLKDTATLEYAAGATFGTGAMTLGAGTTLALTATSSTFTALANAVTLPTEGTATIRIDGRRLRSGDHVIASNVAAGATANVALDPGSTVLDGRKGELRVDGTNLVLTINPTGTVIIVR